MGHEVLRTATLGDLELVCGLVEEFCAVDGHDYDQARVRVALVDLLEGPEPRPGVVWLIVGADVVEGYAVVTWGFSLESGGREALVDELYVRQRRRGLGTQAMAAVLDASRAAGARRIFLETELGNDDARRFYARHGFAADDSIWMSCDL